MTTKRAKAQWRLTQRPDKQGAPPWCVSYRIPPQRWREHRIPREAKLAIDDQAGAEKYAKAFVTKLGLALAQRPEATRAPEGEAITFRTVAEQWTSGELHRRWPDHVPLKRSVADDVSRLERLNEVIGEVTIASFALEDAERAWPSCRRPRERRPRGDSTRN